MYHLFYKLSSFLKLQVSLSHQLVWYWKQLLIAMCTFRQYPRLWSQGETFESFVISWRRWFGSFSEASHFDQSVQTQSCCYCPYLFRNVGTMGLGGRSPHQILTMMKAKHSISKGLGLPLAPKGFSGFPTTLNSIPSSSSPSFRLICENTFAFTWNGRVTLLE